MNKRHYEHTLPNIRGSLSNTYRRIDTTPTIIKIKQMSNLLVINHIIRQNIYFGEYY